MSNVKSPTGETLSIARPGVTKFHNQCGVDEDDQHLLDGHLLLKTGIEQENQDLICSLPKAHLTRGNSLGRLPVSEA